MPALATAVSVRVVRSIQHLASLNAEMTFGISHRRSSCEANFGGIGHRVGEHSSTLSLSEMPRGIAAFIARSNVFVAAVGILAFETPKMAANVR